MVVEMSILKRINRLKSKGISTDENLCLVYYKYREKFGLSHEQMMEEPIPVVMGILRQMIKEDKKQKRRGKK